MGDDIPPIMHNDPSGPYDVGATYVPPPPPPNGHHPKASRPLVDFDELVYSQPMDRELRAAKDDARYQRRRADFFQEEVAALRERLSIMWHRHILYGIILGLVVFLLTWLIFSAIGGHR